MKNYSEVGGGVSRQQHQIISASSTVCGKKERKHSPQVIHSNPKSPPNMNHLHKVLFKSIKKKVFDTVSKKFNLTDKNFKPKSILEAGKEDKVKFEQMREML